MGLVLLHSPLVGVESWGTLPDALRRGGVAALAVRIERDDRPPYARRYAEQAAAAVLAAVPQPVRPPVLAGHSGAGPLLPAVAAALRARGRPAGGHLFCDAGLPRQGATRLDLLAEEDPAMAAGFRGELEAGARFPGWSGRDLEPLVPDPAARAALVACLRPRGLDFFTEPLPPAAGWPDAPCGYLRLSAAYDAWLQRARALGWPTASLDAGHFHALVDPDGLAAALLALLARM
ncbi:MAG TPA: alpha/beta fold hydrolase [Actinomycetes bacterium]|nr:alpha/beta fold hydrolase [Actinomycetes bacterium]